MEHKLKNSRGTATRVKKGRKVGKPSRSSRVNVHSSRKLSNKALENAIVKLPEVYPWKVLDSLRKDLSGYLTDGENRQLDTITRKRDFSAYLSLSKDWGLQSIVPSDTLPAVRARYLLSSILKKYQFNTSEAERESVAKEKFFAAEALCKKVNHNGKPLDEMLDFDVAAFSYARHYIEKVIGKTVPDSQVLMDKARHGPGANLCTEDGKTSSFFKYSEFPYSCTEDAKGLAITMIKQDERWFDLLCTYNSLNRGYTMCNSKKNAVDDINYGVLINDETPGILNEEEFWSKFIKVVPGNRITFVEKNALTKRTIAIEPSLNLMLQLGVDGHIRKQLKRYGVDLDDQSKNQELARIGSICENYCTLDLKAASDTISIWICWLLLPDEWFSYLMRLRSPEGVLGDDVISYEKMSSMGNGFTFALESLIFAAITYAATKMNVGPSAPAFRDFACYGDDLIVKPQHASNLTTLLYKSGFRLNNEKSFFTGACRESCGMDWFKGYNVRPVYIDGLPKDVKELWADYNRLQRNLETRFGISLGQSNTAKLMLKWIPTTYADVIGPRSNEDFDTYRHACEPFGTLGTKYSTELFAIEHVRVVKTPVPKSVNGAYQFRKLMHNLRPFVKDKYSWQGDQSGRRFDVISRQAMTLAKTTAHTDNWCVPYCEAQPKWSMSDGVQSVLI